LAEGVAVPQLAYLVIREGAHWTDVFRLVPGQTVTIGRAPTNQIVLKDERCSRSHAEIFMSEGQWVLRDLESRNGTMVGNQRVQYEWILRPGDVIHIGRSQLVFVHSLTEAFPDTRSGRPSNAAGPNSSSVPEVADDEDSSVLAAYEPTTITHRRGQTRFLEPGEVDEAQVTPLGRAAARLCRLAFELTTASSAAKMAELALNALFEATKTDAGAILLVPRGLAEPIRPSDLEIAASRTLTARSYHRISNFLASTVMREGEAVLARNVLGDSTLGTRDSQGEIYSTSVLCAPIRRGRTVLGLIHLYSTDPERVPDPDDLEFTLAVADTMAVALTNLARQEELNESLTQIRTENVQLRERLGVQSEIIGHSAGIRQVMEQIARAAATKATVLIRGESGVGKELVARAVHFSSDRRNGPFICLNCAALSESLLASELFGHEKGAFTGATERKIGKFEAAHRGTLMLDEIGEMSPSLQAKFLRVLEGHPFERVGGSKPITVDVRVIAATNRDLEKDVAEGRFRRDLYFRLRVIEIIVPPLRKRTEDIPELAQHFLQRFISETGRKIRGFTPKAMDLLLRYHWPGNVRELKNVIERAVVLCRGEYIDEEDLLLSNLASAGETGESRLVGKARFTPCTLDEMERRHILATLEYTGWNKSRTANLLGIERSTLDRKIRRYGIPEPRAFGPPGNPQPGEPAPS